MTSTRSKDKSIRELQEQGYVEASMEQRHQWIRDGQLNGFEIVIVPGGGLWIKPEVGMS